MECHINCSFNLQYLLLFCISLITLTGHSESESVILVGKYIVYSQYILPSLVTCISKTSCSTSHSWELRFLCTEYSSSVFELQIIIGHVNNISTMQFFTGISRNTQSKSYMLSLSECVWGFENDALWDTH